MSTREGFTADVLFRQLRRTILNPYLTIPLSALLTYSQSHSLHPSLPSLPPPVHTAAWSLSLTSLLLTLNDTLNHWSANNFTRSRPNEWSDWSKEIVLITGAAGGIGASIAQQLLRHDIRTKIVVVDYAPMAWTPPAGSKVVYYQCDLSDSAAVKGLCERVRKEVGEVSVLVNNAGLCRGKSVMEGSYGDVELTVRTNLVAPFLLCKEVLPGMVQRNHGHILNVSSMSSVIPPAGVADYAATKAGVCALHEVRNPFIPGYPLSWMLMGDRHCNSNSSTSTTRPTCGCRSASSASSRRRCSRARRGNRNF